MPRSDLLIALVKAGKSGDTESFRSAVETIISDERVKKHTGLADRLTDELNKNGVAYEHARPVLADDTAVDDLCVETTPSRSFDDLILPDAVTGVCREVVEEHRRGELLRSRGLEPRSRILLTGPAGNGKTAVAEALASALAVPFVVARYDGLIAGDFAQTVLRLRRLFDHARARRCVLFFDDFDAVGLDRGDERDGGASRRTLASLLLQIDDLRAHSVVVAATNRPQLVDRAAWRRFQIRLELPSPTVEQIVQFFEKAAARVEVPFGYTPRMIAQMLQGASYSELEGFVSDVARRYILALPDADEKKIVAQCLDQWKKRFKPAP
jgi:SpoVK/Ycf46/Vps4 family AAA+-type ATPase